MREPTKIDAIANAYVDAAAALSPIGASYMGIPGHDHELDDFSPAGAARYADASRATLAELEGLEPVDAVDEVTLASMRHTLGLDVERYEAGDHQWDLNNIASPLQAVRDVFDLMDTEGEGAWETIAARLEAVPNSIHSYVDSLIEGIRAGNTPALRQVEEGARQAQEYGDPASSFFVEFAAGSGAEGALATKLRDAADEAAAAYRRLGDFLTGELAPRATRTDAVGREKYSRASRYFVGATIDLDETYEWGVEALAAIAAEQDALAEQIAGSGATVADAVAALNADPATQIHGTDALREWMQRTSDEAIAALNGRYFDIPDPVRTVDCRIAPTQTGGIYYTGPSEDFSRPGTMWWSVPPGVETFSTWQELTTVYHEGVPGHHLQIGQAVANAAELNRWRRLASGNSGHAEGWALYSERLMEEFGFLDAPGDRFGMLDAQRLRAVRVVVDLGVHLGKPAFERYGGGTWDYDKAWALLRDNVQIEEKQLRFELCRYMGWPGQAPSYRVGQRLIEQTRAEATRIAAERGEEFSLKDFHTRLLNMGGVPLGVLQDQLTR